jgi:hypothetical protein
MVIVLFWYLFSDFIYGHIGLWYSKFWRVPRSYMWALAFVEYLNIYVSIVLPVFKYLTFDFFTHLTIRLIKKVKIIYYFN